MLPATPPAIAKSLEILATHRALFGDGVGPDHAPRSPRRTKVNMAEQDIARVVQIFREIGVRWALVGAHASGIYTEPRATSDFDFIIEGTRLTTVVRALADEHGDLDVEDIGAAVRLRAIDIDLIRSTNHPLFTQALDHVVPVSDWLVCRGSRC